MGGAFCSCLVQEAVRAGMVNGPSDYSGLSYQSKALGEATPLKTVRSLLLVHGKKYINETN
jgi:hypothetical protein